MVINIVEKNKKKKPVAARGKTTKKEAVKRSMKKALRGLAMGAPAGLAKRIRSVSPGMKKAMTGSATGMGGAGLMAMARKIKPTGRISAADLERVKKMMARKIKPTGRISAADLERVKKVMGKKAGGELKTGSGGKLTTGFGKLMTKKDAQIKADRLNRRSPLTRAMNFKVVDTGQKGKGILSKLPVQASGTRFTVKGNRIKSNRRVAKPNFKLKRK